MPLSSLPPEIISSVLFHLDADSIVSLGSVIPLVISKQVYDHAFPFDTTRLTDYNMAQFAQRAQARVYTMGTGGWAFGPESDSPPKYAGGIPEALEIQTKSAVVQASLFDGLALMLNCRGQIDYVRPEFPSLPERSPAREQVTDDYDPNRYETQRQQEEDSGSAVSYNSPLSPQLPPPSESLVKASQALFSQPYKPTKFVKFVESYYLYALDDAGMIWISNNTDWAPVCTILDGPGGAAPENNTFGDYSYVCFFDGEGISKCEFREATTSPNGSRNGYPCLDDHLCYLEAKHVPDTGSVISFAVVGYALICLRKDGTVTGVELELGADSNLASEVDKLNKLGRFVYVVASDHRVGLVTKAGQVVIVSIQTQFFVDYTLEVEIVAGLEGVKVVSLAISDNQCLALTEEGDVYSWGRDTGCCLGFGYRRTAETLADVTLDGSWMIVEKPTKVPLARKAFAVYAGNGMSGVLM